MMWQGDEYSISRVRCMQSLDTLDLHLVRTLKPKPYNYDFVPHVLDYSTVLNCKLEVRVEFEHG